MTSAVPLFSSVAGFSTDDGGGGIYEFATRADAEAWFNDEWADWMEDRFGVQSILTIFDSPAVLNNEAGEVRVNGAPVPAPWKQADHSSGAGQR